MKKVEELRDGCVVSPVAPLMSQSKNGICARRRSSGGAHWEALQLQRACWGEGSGRGREEAQAGEEAGEANRVGVAEEAADRTRKSKSFRWEMRWKAAVESLPYTMKQKMQSKKQKKRASLRRRLEDVESCERIRYR